MIDPKDISDHAPGFFGSLFAALWIRDTWPRRVAYVAAGAVTSHYASPAFSRWTELDLPLSGFLTGLFAMAIAAKAFETIEVLKPQAVISAVLKRWTR